MEGQPILDLFAYELNKIRDDLDYWPLSEFDNSFYRFGFEFEQL